MTTVFSVASPGCTCHSIRIARLTLPLSRLFSPLYPELCSFQQLQKYVCMANDKVVMTGAEFGCGIHRVVPVLTFPGDGSMRIHIVYGLFRKQNGTMARNDRIMNEVVDGLSAISVMPFSSGLQALHIHALNGPLYPVTAVNETEKDYWNGLVRCKVSVEGHETYTVDSAIWRTMTLPSGAVSILVLENATQKIDLAHPAVKKAALGVDHARQPRVIMTLSVGKTLDPLGACVSLGRIQERVPYDMTFVCKRGEKLPCHQAVMMAVSGRSSPLVQAICECHHMPPTPPSFHDSGYSSVTPKRTSAKHSIELVYHVDIPFSVMDILLKSIYTQSTHVFTMFSFEELHSYYEAARVLALRDIQLVIATRVFKVMLAQESSIDVNTSFTALMLKVALSLGHVYLPVIEKVLHDGDETVVTKGVTVEDSLNVLGVQMASWVVKKAQQDRAFRAAFSNALKLTFNASVIDLIFDMA